MSNHILGIAYAKQLDKEDTVSHYREQFHIPKDKDGNNWLYFTGNSLGLQPKATQKYIQQELEDWANFGVEGHFEAKNPWLSYHELLTDAMAKVVGAKPVEVVVMNTLTTNLHLLMVSFYQPSKTKYKIIIESDAFPSDRYAVQSQLSFHGFDPEEALIEWKPKEGKELLELEDLKSILDSQGDEVALLLIGGVNYYTGQYLDIKKIAELGHAKKCMVGIDLAHGAGNVQPNLHDSSIDFAAWCTYKYLNSGPGSLSGLFVHEKHAQRKDLPRFAGWWGTPAEDRFQMTKGFVPAAGADAWQLSNAPVLSMAVHKVALELHLKAGVDRLIEKQKKLTSYLEFILTDISDRLPAVNFTVITPRERGSQLSILTEGSGKELFNKMTEQGVVADWREPNVIRVAPVPMYNSFTDVFNFGQIIEKSLEELK